MGSANGAKILQSTYCKPIQPMLMFGLSINDKEGEMSDDRYIHKTKPGHAIAPHARKVDFIGETPNEDYHGFVEVIGTHHSTIEIHLARSTLKKYKANAKWHTQSVYATISASDWRHLLTLGA